MKRSQYSVIIKLVLVSLLIASLQTFGIAQVDTTQSKFVVELGTNPIHSVVAPSFFGLGEYPSRFVLKTGYKRHVLRMHMSVGHNKSSTHSRDTISNIKLKTNDEYQFCDLGLGYESLLGRI